MKILFLSNIPSPYRMDFFNELGKKVDLTVVFEAEMHEKLNKSWFTGCQKNFKCIFLKKGTIEEKKINFKIFKYLKKNHYDFVVVTNYAYLTEMLALIYIKFRKIPYLLEVDGGLIRKENKIKYLFKKFLISNAKGYISPSQSTDDFLIHYGAERLKIHRYNFTSLKEEEILKQEISLNEKQQIRKKLNIKEENVILSVGRMVPIKGFDILIDAIRMLPKDVGVYIVGGKPLDELLKLKKKYELNNLYFIDFKSKAEVNEYYMCADLFVLPTRGDVWGLVINEAMAKGLPVITTNKCVAGLELIKDSFNGFMTPVEDSEALAEKIKVILESPDLSCKMKRNNLEKISQYTIEKMVDRHLEILNKNNGGIK